MQRGALARAGRSVERDELARLDTQVEPAQRDRLRGTGAEDPEHVVELKRPKRELLSPFGLAVKAPQLHRKLSIINR